MVTRYKDTAAFLLPARVETNEGPYSLCASLTMPQEEQLDRYPDPLLVLPLDGFPLQIAQELNQGIGLAICDLPLPPAYLETLQKL